VAASNLMKGTYKGQDLSGKYRFTDTWVKRNGKWDVVASQYTKVAEVWPGNETQTGWSQKHRVVG